MASTKVPSELIANTAILGQHLHTTLGNTGVTANSSGLFIGQSVATSDTVQFQTVTGSHAGTIAAATTGTTQANTDNSAKMATTEFVTNKIQELIGGAPSTLNDLNELAAAINDDASYNSTLTTALATKAPIASPTFAGNTRVNGDFSVSAATGEDRLVIAPQAAGSGTFVISYNAAANAYEPLTMDFETLALRTSGTPRLSIDSSGTITIPGKILYSNVYSAEGDLPSASTYHGMFAHVHGTGAGYFAHAGAWTKLANQSNLDTTTTTANAALPLAGGTMTGNLRTGDGTNISMDSSSNGQLEIDGNGYAGAIALDATAMHIYHNSSGRSLILGTDETARLTINGATTTIDGDLEVSGGTGTTSVSQIGFTNYADTAYLRSKYYDPSATTETYLAFHTNKSGASNGTVAEHMRLKGNSLGINTTNPAAKLHVHNPDGGNATDKAGMLSEAVMKLQPHATNSTNMLIAQVDNGSSMGIQVTNGPATANWDLSLSPFGGNVGIGTVAPGEKLEVDGIIQIKRTGDHPAMRFVEGSDTRGYMGSGDWAINGGADDDFGISAAGTGDLLFGTTGGVEKMRIKNGGDVLFNVDSDSQLLIGNAGTNATKIYAGVGDELYIGGNNNYALRFLNDGTNNVVFDNNSKIGIGTTSFAADGSSLVQVAGRLGIMENTGTQLQISTGSTYSWMEAWDNTADRAPKRPICFNPWGGNVGIGTTDPTAALEVNRGSAGYAGIFGAPQGSGKVILFKDNHASPNKYNFLVGSQYNVNNAFEITPSTVVGGFTFSHPSMQVDAATGVVGFTPQGNTTTSQAVVSIGEAKGVRAGVLNIRSTSGTAGGIRHRMAGGSQYLNVASTHTGSGTIPYWHIKTNIYYNQNIMFVARVHGYAYGGSGHIIDMQRSGYAYSGSSTGVIATQFVNNGTSSSAALDPYYTSAGQLCFRAFATTSSYYTGWAFDIKMQSPTGYDKDFVIDAHHMNSTSGNYYT